MPKALSEARCQLDHWRSQQPNKRTRLPKELWQQAVTPANENGLNKTARALGLKYYSLKKHLEATATDESKPAKTRGEFMELSGYAPKDQRFLKKPDFFKSAERTDFAYHVIACNWDAIGAFRTQIAWLWYRTLRRLGRKIRLNGDRMEKYVDTWLPPVRILHP